MRLPDDIELPEGLLEDANAVADAMLGPAHDLAELVRRVSRTYTRERDAMETASSRDALQARLRFFLSRDFWKVAPPLLELDLAGALPERTWKVLDLGAGVGTTSLGVAEVARRLGRDLRVTAVERDEEATRCFRALAERRSLSLEAHVGSALAPPGGRFDLVTIGLMLNELPLEDRRRLLEVVAERLDTSGSVVILEPALHDVARELQALRDELASDWTIFAPCLRRGPCPMLESERHWCHEELDFRLPRPLREVAREAGLRGERLTWSYLTLRRDGRRLADVRDGSRVVSAPLVSKGKRELFVCDEGGHRRLVRLDRHRSDATRGFDDAVRGDVLRVRGEVPKGRGHRLGPDAEATLADWFLVGLSQPPTLPE